MKLSLRPFLSLLFISLITLGLVACDKNKPAETSSAGHAPDTGKVYRVGMNAAFAPFGSVNEAGKIVGFDADIMQAIADQAGIKIVWVNTPWEGIFSTLAQGDIDIIASAVTITDERKQSMLFSDPYFEAKQVILVPPGKDITTPEDLKKANKVGVTTSTSADTVVQKILGKTNKAIVRFESLPLLLKEVDAGGVDAAVGDNGAVENYVKNNNSKGFKLIYSDDFTKEYYGIAVRKEDTALIAKINAALKTLRENGTYDKIYARYFAK
ncbi:basic amino acid ABC transporter substrate-binding protein [Glaciimonas soli]|uniref:Transporter substrate-binding domain-containing protein n=1 Tax=Glaciimonas soli TaxID=2590999 RepID=A0A843YWV3_9BURK|nr:basic amino acid ABC transporter substrate-binding protein [Glaciimonas soli]MQR01036.1 transporter substrate-binding domain-containing protein [Glaciimonas soli]